MYSDGQSVNQSVIRSLSLSAILIVIEKIHQNDIVSRLRDNVP